MTTEAIPSLEPVLVGSLGDAWKYLARAAIEADPGRKRMEKALREIVDRPGKVLYNAEPWLLSDMGHAYEAGKRDAHEECAKIAHAALGDGTEG